MMPYLRAKAFWALALVAVFACNKKDAPQSPEEQLAEKRKADADYNNKITPGVGNIFYEEKLTPNAPNQLVFKIAYNSDTLAGYGKINSSGQLQYLTSTVLAKKGNTELLVTELFPEVSKSRMYTILNGVKGSMVVEMNHLSATRVSMAVLDMNWETGVSKVIKQSYFENGKPTANYSSFKLTGEGGDRVYNCAEPQPSEDLSKTVDNNLDYFQCGGHAYDTYPALQAIKTAILTAVESIKNASQFQSKADELKSLEANYGALNNLFKSLNDKISDYKFEKSILGGFLKELAEKINKLKAELKPDVVLVPYEAISDRDYDEVTDNEIKLVFTLIDNKTQLPYTEKPISIDMAFLIPGTNQALHMESRFTSMANGLVTFKLDPTTLPDYQKYTSLTAKYAFTSDDWNKSATRPITLKFIKPKVVMANGTAIPSPVKYATGDTKTFKLVNEDGRDIVVNYNDVTLNNSNNKVGYSMLKGTTNFDLTLTTNETTEQFTSLNVIYKQKQIQTINASVAKEMDSTAIYAAAVLGNWFVYTFQGGPASGYTLELRADGSGSYITKEGVKYNMTWGIGGGPGRGYYLSDSGFWHPAYAGEDRDRLTFPPSGFKTYSALLEGKQSRMFERK